MTTPASLATPAASLTRPDLRNLAIVALVDHG
jgi:hypothetical protein